MKTFFKKTALGLALGATAMTAVAPAAQAHTQYRRGGGGSGAIIGGILGVVIGSAIASSSNRRGTYYRSYNNRSYNYRVDPRYQNDGRYYQPNGYRSDPRYVDPRGYSNGYDGAYNTYPGGQYNTYPGGQSAYDSRGYSYGY